MDDLAFFAKPRTAATLPAVFAADTRHPGVIHARVLYLLEQGLIDEALKLVGSRKDVVQDSTWQLLATHPATRHLYA